MNDLEKGKKSYSPSVSGWLARIFNLNENAVRWFLSIVLFIIFCMTFVVIWKELGPGSHRVPSPPEGMPAPLEQQPAEVKG